MPPSLREVDFAKQKTEGVIVLKPYINFFAKILKLPQSYGQLPQEGALTVDLFSKSINICYKKFGAV